MRWCDITRSRDNAREGMRAAGADASSRPSLYQCCHSHRRTRTDRELHAGLNGGGNGYGVL